MIIYSKMVNVSFCRHTIVTYVCDAAVDPPITVVNGEIDLTIYVS